MYNFLLFIALYLPFQLALNPAAGVDLASIRVLILLLFFIWLAQGFKNKKIKISNNLQTWLVLSFLFLNVFSIIAARNADWSLRKILFLLSIFPVYFVAGAVLNSKEKAMRAVKFLVLSGSVAALIGIAQFSLQFTIGLEKTYKIWAGYVVMPFLGNTFGEAVLKNPSWLVNIAGKTYLRATSLFPDPHMFSFYLGLLLPAALGMIFCQKRTGLFITAFFLLLIADILTFSRGGYLGLFAALLTAVILLWAKIPAKYKLGAVAGLFLALVVLLAPSPVSQRFWSSLNLKEGSNQGRLLMWEKAGDVITEHPILGVGIGNYPLEVNAAADYREPIYAHNTYLDIAAETGLLSGLFWVVIFITAAAGFLKLAKKEKFFLFLFVSLVIFATHSLTETAIYSPTVLTLLLILLSLSKLKLENEENI